MASLKLSAITDDKPIKVTVELPAQLHRDLSTYAQALAQEAKTWPPEHFGIGACLTHMHDFEMIFVHVPFGTSGHADATSFPVAGSA